MTWLLSFGKAGALPWTWETYSREGMSYPEMVNEWRTQYRPPYGLPSMPTRPDPGVDIR